MGGAVSAGKDNDELIDNLMSGNYIRSEQVERVFRALDRADYMTPNSRDQAYKDLAWRDGPLHLSSPCIYCEVVEGLKLRPGLSFLNIGSGTGYLNTLVGLILGTSGINHGVDYHPMLMEYSDTKLKQFLENSPVLDDFDFCEPKFFQANGMCLSPSTAGYDRLYCGAGCPLEYQDYFKRLIKVGGILVMPVADTLLQIRRVEENKWTTQNLLSVSFALLKVPSRSEAAIPVKLDDQAPVRLALLSRAVVREELRKGVIRRHPELREVYKFLPPLSCPRRICIPIEPGGTIEGLNVLHGLDNDNGGNEMNALLSLVISMGQNRVAETLRFESMDSPTDSSEDEEEEEEEEESESTLDQKQTDGTAQAEQSDQPGKSVQPGQSEQPGKSEQPGQSEQPKPPKRKNKKKDRGEPNILDGMEIPRFNQGRRRSLDTNSDSEDPSPARPRNKRPDFRLKSSMTDTQRRHRRLHPEDFDGSRHSRLCRELLIHNDIDQPSTSGKNTETSSEEITDSSDPKSSDDSAKCSMDSNTPSKPRCLPGMPSEVEIDLGNKVAPEASTSQIEMDWEASKSEDDVTEVTNNKAKRQKLDSGIGETTPSSSSGEKSKSGSESDVLESAENGDAAAERRAARRAGARVRVGGGAEIPVVVEGEEDECMRAHLARRRRRVARGGDARRVRLSLLMKQAVRELPLPPQLKRFVNLGRCYLF